MKLFTNTIFLISLLSIWMMTVAPLSAQRENVILTNTQQIDPNRYEGVRGSPYLFEEWYPGIIIDTEGAPMEAEQINYNAHTKSFEIKKGDRFIELDPTYNQEVRLTLEEGKTLLFKKPPHSSLPEQFVLVLYDGAQVQLIKTIEKDITSKVFQDVGKKRTVKAFAKISQLYLVENGELRRMKRNKKSVLKTFKGIEGVDAFIKKKKLKFKDDADLVEVVAFYEQEL